MHKYRYYNTFAVYSCKKAAVGIDSINFLKSWLFLSTFSLPVISICLRARVIATFSFRSIICPVLR